jgi:hypothetical protein
MGIDTNTDPRCPIGYKLATSGKQFFDNVIIFHAGLAAKNCGSLPVPADNNYCPKTGLHLHWSDEIQWLIAN